MNHAKQHIVIVGGGIIGTACAHYLSIAGSQVTILEQDRHGSGCSHGNCGYISPSHVLPLTEPGAVKEGIRSLFQPDAPFRIKPRFDPALWKWLTKFALRCNQQDMLQAAQGIHVLLESSMSLYCELLDREEMECDWEKRGLMFVFQSREMFDRYAETDHLLREHFGVGAIRIEGEELAEREPALKSGLAGAWHYEHDAHLRADRLLSAWRKRLEQAGVEIREHCEVNGITSQGSDALAVKTNRGEIAADQFVFATGAWTPFFNKILGCKIPIQPGKGYSITMPRPELCPQYPMLFPEVRVGVTPWKSGFRLGSMMEFAGYDRSLSEARVQMLKEGAARFLRQPYAEPIEERWYGWRPMTYDSVPIIDRVPRFGNVFLATGHNMLGLSMATGTGKLISELITGETPHLSLTPYRVTRF